MFDLQCDICQETFPINKFQFDSCGHGFCEGCTERTQFDRTCPICRRLKSKDGPHKIYFTPADPSTKEQAKSVAHAMNSLGQSSSPESTIRIGVKLRKLSKEVDENTARQLLDVAKRMDERLYPLIHQLQLECDEKRAMQEKFNLWLPRVKRTEIAESEADQLKEETTRLQLMLKNTSERLECEKQENERLRSALTAQHRSNEEKERKLQHLSTKKEIMEKEVRLAKRKLRALGSTSSKASLRRADEDDSLIVLS